MQQVELDIIQQALSILDSHLKTKGTALQSPGAVRSFLRLQLEREESEVFAVLYLDTRHRVLEFVRLFNGTIDGAAVYPREVVKTGLAVNASAAIISTLTDLLQARNDALRLIEDARRITAMAKQLLEQHGPYLMPRGAEASDAPCRVRVELDSSMWRRALDLTGFKQLMDAQAVSEFERSLGSDTPEFTEATIRATFIDLRINAEAMFRRGVFNVFRYLSDDYRTNATEPFRIGRKVIMSYMIRASYRRGLAINHGGADKLNDLDRVFQVLDDKPFQPRALESAMNAAFEESSLFESDYYRARAFKNGNLHLEFKRLDLLDKVNGQIAEFYADGALPDARRA